MQKHIDKLLLCHILKNERVGFKLKAKVYEVLPVTTIIGTSFFKTILNIAMVLYICISSL